jgi:NAD(P)-dependent dehydrogenase (short-subunit alcohol dehydrogenase family)
VLAQSQPIRRAGQPDDIANIALFLASDESQSITGTAIDFLSCPIANHVRIFFSTIPHQLGDLSRQRER